jgi:hypothetical protein
MALQPIKKNLFSSRLTSYGIRMIQRGLLNMEISAADSHHLMVRESFIPKQEWKTIHLAAHRMRTLYQHILFAHHPIGQSQSQPN